jgi:hypothetical protein
MEGGGYASDLHVHCAVVLAVAAAAGGKLRIVRCEGERGRDQRQAEDEQQQDGERAAHEVIVLEISEKPESRAVELQGTLGYGAVE